MIEYLGDKSFDLLIDDVALMELFRIINPNLDYEVHVFHLPDDLSAWKEVTGKDPDQEKYTFEDFKKLAKAYQNDTFREPEFVFTRNGEIIPDQITGNGYRTKCLFEKIVTYSENRL